MISIVIDSKVTRWTREIKYVFGFIFQTLGYNFRFLEELEDLKVNDILLVYGYTEPTPEELKSLAKHFITFFIPCDPDFFDAKAYSADRLRRCMREIKLLNITPVISNRKFEYPAENYTESDISGGKINFDLVGNLFLHLSNLEESSDAGSMEKGFYPDSASAFYNYRETPIVDNLLWLMDSLIKEHCRAKNNCIVQKLLWPSAQQAAVLLSHSIDDLQKWDVSSLILSIPDDLAMFFTFRWKQLAHTLTGKIQYLFTNYELNWNFDEFLKYEKDSNCRSTYFLATEANEEIDYSLEDPDLQEEIQKILHNGNDIGLLATADKLTQDDYLTRKQILLHLLGKEKLGIRQLNYKSNNTIRELQNKISPAFSQSTAFQSLPGYKNGMSLPWQPWVNGTKMDYWELPTIYRDEYLKINKHNYLQLEDAKHQLKKFFQNALRTHSIFSTDFTIASFSNISYMNKLYPYLLALIKSSNTYLTTAGELIDWWEKRNRVTINESEDQIGLIFPDDLDNFTLFLLGNPKIKEVAEMPAKVKGNQIQFSNIKADSIAVIVLEGK